MLHRWSNRGPHTYLVSLKIEGSLGIKHGVRSKDPFYAAVKTQSL